MNRRRQGGFSLIEVLVAVLIVSVGVLGIAGLQLLALQNNTSALLRTQAFQAAYDIIDRARLNRGESYEIAMDADAPTAQDCTTTNCTTTQMRDYDLNEWLTSLAATLPNGDGSVVQAAGVTTVTVRWQDERDPNAAPLDISLETSL